MHRCCSNKRDEEMSFETEFVLLSNIVWPYQKYKYACCCVIAVLSIYWILLNVIFILYYILIWYIYIFRYTYDCYAHLHWLFNQAKKRYLKWRYSHNHIFTYIYIRLMQGKTHPQNSLIRLSTSILGTCFLCVTRDTIWWILSKHRVTEKRMLIV